jgi:preprotein translocase subunit Sec61beta
LAGFIQEARVTSNQANSKNTNMKKIDMQLVIEYAIIFAVLVVLAAIKVFI